MIAVSVKTKDNKTVDIQVPRGSTLTELQTIVLDAVPDAAGWRIDPANRLGFTYAGHTFRPAEDGYWSVGDILVHEESLEEHAIVATAIRAGLNVPPMEVVRWQDNLGYKSW